MSRTIFDKTAFSILTRLHSQEEGLRFKDLKKLISVTEPRLSRKIALLKAYRLIAVTAVVTEEEKFFAYKITESGKEFANHVEILRLMEKVEQLDMTLPQVKVKRRKPV